MMSFPIMRSDPPSEPPVHGAAATPTKLDGTGITAVSKRQKHQAKSHQSEARRG